MVAGQEGATGKDSGMKQVLIFCDHCEHRINFHDPFRRNGTLFYHALCWELYLLECVDKVRAFKQAHAPHTGATPPPRAHGDRYF